MSAAKKPRVRAPRVATTPAPSTATTPPGLVEHVLASDGGRHCDVEISLPLRANWPEYGERGPSAFVRVHVADVWGPGHGAGGWETIDLPLSALEDIAANFAEVVALAKYHGLLPART